MGYFNSFTNICLLYFKTNKLIWAYFNGQFNSQIIGFDQSNYFFQRLILILVLTCRRRKH